MAMTLSYATATYRPPDAVIPDNSTASDPVEFDLVPAEGGDMARIKSVIVSMAGLASEGVWSPEVQRSVVAAFDHGAPAFVHTITAIRGLSLPWAMAARSGLAPDGPQFATLKPEERERLTVPVTTGVAFSRICGYLPVLSLLIANEIVSLSNKSGIDARFFDSPSGSPDPATPAATPSVAVGARTPPEGHATVASLDPTGPRPHGTSRRGRSR